MRKQYGYVLSAGAACGAVLAIYNLAAKAQPLLASEPPPWVGKMTTQQFAQNFQQLQKQTQELAKTVESIQITTLLRERAEAQNQINDAAKVNRRDPIAEQVRDRANAELMRIMGTAPPP